MTNAAQCEQHNCAPSYPDTKNAQWGPSTYVPYRITWPPCAAAATPDAPTSVLMPSINPYPHPPPGAASSSAPYQGTPTPYSNWWRTETTAFHCTTCYTWRWGPPPFHKRPPPPPPQPVRRLAPGPCTPQGPKWAIAMIPLKAEATMPTDLDGESHIVVDGLKEHILIMAMYAAARTPASNTNILPC